MASDGLWDVMSNQASEAPLTSELEPPLRSCCCCCAACLPAPVASAGAEQPLLILCRRCLPHRSPSQEAVTLAKKCLGRARSRGSTRQSAARVAATVLTRAAVDRGSRDNVTVVIVDLSPMSPAEIEAAARLTEVRSGRVPLGSAARQRCSALVWLCGRHSWRPGCLLAAHRRPSSFAHAPQAAARRRCPPGPPWAHRFATLAPRSSCGAAARSKS